MPSPVIVWFRRDLRLADNPALAAAVAADRPIIPLYVLDEVSPGIRPLGGAQRWWLHHSLSALGRDLAARGLGLVLRRGPAETVVADLARQVGADSVLWNRCYDPGSIRRDAVLKRVLVADGRQPASFNAGLLVEPWHLQTGAGGFYRVFTPFWRALRARFAPPAPLPAPAGLPAMSPAPAGDALDSWALLPTRPDWAGGLRDGWTPGEAGARARLARFLADGLAHYEAGRDRPDRAHGSRLSPHLQWGELGPRQVWHAIAYRAASEPALDGSADSFLRELGWREFSQHLLFHVPSLATAPLRPEFDDFPWRPDPVQRAAWAAGRTGYPIVDAGMRELWYSGWMHNRVRMIAGSFLVKDLLQPWQAGEAWFWDTLVDADHATNPASWQWVAGCGADAAPFFRVFNPVLQGEKFDPRGAYVRRWLPELAGLPDDCVHKPWLAPAAVLARAGVRLDQTYPRPIVDHKAARARALAAFAHIKPTAA